MGIVRVGVHRLFLTLAFHISMFSTHPYSPAIRFHSCFFFTADVSAPIRSTLTYFLGEFPGLRLALIPDVLLPGYGSLTSTRLPVHSRIPLIMKELRISISPPSGVRRR